jgi:hypothetical protein
VRQWLSFLSLRTVVRAWRSCEPCYHLPVGIRDGAVQFGVDSSSMVRMVRGVCLYSPLLGSTPSAVAPPTALALAAQQSPPEDDDHTLNVRRPARRISTLSHASSSSSASTPASSDSLRTVSSASSAGGSGGGGSAMRATPVRAFSGSSEDLAG